MVTTGSIFGKKKNHFQDFRIRIEDTRQNSVDADIAA